MRDNACVIRIVLVDRQELFREGLKRLLHSDPAFAVVGGAGTAPHALDLVRGLDPDVLLLDLGLQGGESVSLLQALAAARHRVRTIGLTAASNKDARKTALRHGARGALLKEGTTAQLFASIRKVFDDEHWVCPDEAPPAAAETRGPGPVEAEARGKRFKLTPREMDIVSAVAAGESNKGIAQKLSLSEDTVKHHVSNVFDKLGVFSRLELAVFAFNHDLVQSIADLMSQG